MIVLSITNPESIVWGEVQFIQGSQQPAAFINAGGQDHHGALVKDHASFEAEISNHLKDGLFIRRTCSDDGFSDMERRHVASPVLFDKGRDRWRSEKPNVFCGGRVQDRPIFRYHTLTQ